MDVRLRRWYGDLLLSGGQVIVIGLAFFVAPPWAVPLCALGAAISFFAWRSALARYRLVADMPTSPIASAAQGYLAIDGTGRMVPDWFLPSPMTGLNCLWYRWYTEQKVDGKWREIDSGETQEAFLIDDGTAACLVVDPERAEIFVREKDVRLSEDHCYRRTEWRLVPGERIYAIGQFRTRNASVELDVEADLGHKLATWKQDYKSLLARFDLDGDGEISLDEWQLVRAAARREVLKEHVETRRNADFHTFSQPEDGQIYLIANLPPEKIARRYRYWALAHLALFFVAVAALPWLWATGGR